MKVLNILFILGLLAGGGYYTYQNDLIPGFSSPNVPSAAVGAINTTADQPTALSKSGQASTDIMTTSRPIDRSSNGIVLATGVVKPQRAATLSMVTEGLVKKILVQEGEHVEEGQVLIELDNVQKLVNLTQAQAELNKAKALLAETQAGSRTQEVDAAQAAVDIAQAQLSNLSRGIRAEDEVAGQAVLNAAQAQLQHLHNGPEQESLIAAHTVLQNAEAVVKRAQSAYNQVKWRNDVGMLPESLDLEQANNELNAARARYNELAKGPTQAEIANAQAQIENAKAALQSLRVPSTQNDIAAAQAELRRTQAQLALVQAGTRTEAILVAQAEVEAAKATLLRAEADLMDTYLKAPFAGVVAGLSVEAGEFIFPGAAAVELGNLSEWRIETDNLIELDIVKVKLGSPVLIQIDAIPDLELNGVVARIRSIGEDRVGDITYTVLISLDDFDDRLQWNMSASVIIDPELPIALAADN